MASVNKAIIVGNLGADPELTQTSSGTSVCNLSIATNERWTDRSGQKQERTEWHRVVVFGRQAENCNRYLEKGRQVYIEGRIQTRKWEDKDGNNRYTTEIVALTVQFLSGGSSGGGGGGYDSPPPPSDDFAGGGGFDDDEIPF
jgi:single-strand DNA-binding protein